MDKNKINNPPEVPIHVDPESGIWSTDGLPMLYVPRHFFNNFHLAIASKISHQEYDQILYESGYKSAYYWCQQQSSALNLEAKACFDHYLKRLSQRGWGLFEFEFADFDHGKARIRLKNSSFVLHLRKFEEQQDKKNLKNGACYLFRGWFAGAADWVDKKNNFQSQGGYCCKETQCAIHGPSDSEWCYFDLWKEKSN